VRDHLFESPEPCLLSLCPRAISLAPFLDSTCFCGLDTLHRLRAVAFLVFDLRETRLHQLFDQGSGQRLIDGKANGSLRRWETSQLALERFDNRRGGEKTTVV
jgi:hypothetical protein